MGGKGRSCPEAFRNTILIFKVAKQILFAVGYFALAPLLVNFFLARVFKSDLRVNWRFAAFFD